MTEFFAVKPRHSKAKFVDYQKKYSEQRTQFLDVIEEEGTIGEARLKIKLGWGDGTFNRRKAEVLELFPGFINWNPHTKIYTWLKSTIDKPLTEETMEKSVWQFQA